MPCTMGWNFTYVAIKCRLEYFLNSIVQKLCIQAVCTSYDIGPLNCVRSRLANVTLIYSLPLLDFSVLLSGLRLSVSVSVCKH